MISVVIPTIPPRKSLLMRAIDSVASQTLQPSSIIVTYDNDKMGAPKTRTVGLNSSTSKWTAFLDDDDYFLADHLFSLYAEAESDNYDVIYSGCMVLDSRSRQVPLRDEWGRFGKPFDADTLRDHSWLGIYSLVRTDLAKSVGGFTYPQGSGYEDWGFYLKMLDAGARFLHVPKQTYVWNHIPNTGNSGLGNTSGKAENW